MKKNDSTTATAKKSPLLQKHRDRKRYLLQLSYVPVAICLIAFAKSAAYRVTTLPEHCRSFGWYSSSSGEFQCDYRPLDVHATLALLWLAVYSAQVALLSVDKSAWHRLFGRLGLVVAALNAVGMFGLAISDVVHPMERTDRPPDFTPFMFLVAGKVSTCLGLSVYCLFGKNERDVEGHMMWMYRTFICSFTTPVIRFYPLILRLAAGDDCFQRHRDKFVMGAMFVSELVCVVMYAAAQRKTQIQFWDTFMKLQAVTFLLAAVKEIAFATEHGMFVTGMIQCAADKYL
jgi:hypothetical protein